MRLDAGVALQIVIAAFLLNPAAAQTITDGDTLKLGGTAYRLHGIDAPELAQTCGDWPAGRLSASALQRLIAGRSVTCEDLGRDRYKRTIARCRAGGVDLGAAMVRQGWAWAFVRYSSDYVDQEKRARADRLGVHAHGCLPAWEWRAAR